MLRGIESTTIGGYGVTVRSSPEWFNGLDRFDDFVVAARRAGVTILISDDHRIHRNGDLWIGRYFPRSGDDPFATGVEVLFKADLSGYIHEMADHMEISLTADRVKKSLMALGFSINYGALS